jgi:hypothetical protein
VSGSLFNWDWYTDPPWDQVSLWWMWNYVNNINPAARKQMLENEASFEKVPVPITLLRHMAANDAALKKLPAQARFDSAPVVEVASQFARALESGDVADAMKHVAKSYYDPAGRDAAGLRKSLDTLVKETRGLKIAGLKATDAAQLGGDVVAVTLEARWEAGHAGRGKAARSKIQVFLTRGKGKQWQIESVETR